MDFLSNNFNIAQQLILLVILFLSIAFHEYAHGWAAHQLGDDTAERAGRLTLNPLAHIDVFGSIILPLMLLLSTGGKFTFGWAKPVPYDPANLKNPRWGSALVAAAGPFSNIILAILASIVFRSLNQATYFEANVSALLLQFFFSVSFLNLFLALFNLIPIPPLDGSKLLAAFLPEVGRRIFDFFERLGIIVVFVVVLLAVNLIAPFLLRLTLLIFGFFAGV